jgi:hypothetical protein
MFVPGGMATTLELRTSAWPKTRLLAEAETEVTVGVVSNCRSSSGMTVKAKRL